MGGQIALAVWVVDSLVKVLPNTLPPTQLETVMRLEAAGGEYASAQIAVRSPEAGTLTIRVTPPTLQGGGTAAGELKLTANVVGFVPIKSNTPDTPDSELVCKAPCEIPDPLLPDQSVRLSRGRTQPIWLTLYVPAGTPAGRYVGKVTASFGERAAEVALEVNVLGFDLPSERHLLVTNWFSTENIAKAHHVSEGTDAYYAVLAEYARNMAEHRQNVFWASPWLAKVTREPDGRLSFDYTQFDRFVETFLKAGVKDLIEIQHVAHPGEGGWASHEILLSEVKATDRATGKEVMLSPEKGLGPLLADLERHLKARGWLDRAIIHVCDEPGSHNIESWRRASEFVHCHAPRIRRIDAIEATGFGGALEVWVPKLNHLRNWEPAFEAARRRGAELWYYICCHPTGAFMNRFLDFAPIKVRLLHWLNYRYDLAGYLHWGLNFWSDDPFGPPSTDLPPGDTHVIYPGKDGPLSSIRWEIQRESLQDYELLRLLDARQREVARRIGKGAAGLDPAARSAELCRRAIHDFMSFEHDPAALRALRSELAHEIEAAPAEPLLLWETLPRQDVTLVPGPIVVDVRGAVQPGAKVQVNGKEIAVRQDGSFYTQVSPSASEPSIAVEVERNGARKRLVRRFTVVAASRAE